MHFVLVLVSKLTADTEPGRTLIVILLHHGDRGTLSQPYSPLRYSFHDMDYQYISIKSELVFIIDGTLGRGSWAGDGDV